MNKEGPKQPGEKLEILEEEAKKLIAEGNLVRLIKNGQKFYFDGYDLDKNLDKFFELRRNGWEVAETIHLPAYFPSRKAYIKDMELAPKDWGYKKVKK